MTDLAMVPLRLAFQGMDERTVKLFRMFLQGPCRKQAELVSDGQAADACLIDMDVQRATELLERERKIHPDRVRILLALNDCTSSPEEVFVKKPVQTESMLQAIRRVREILESRRSKEAERAKSEPDTIPLRTVAASKSQTDPYPKWRP